MYLIIYSIYALELMGFNSLRNSNFMGHSTDSSFFKAGRDR